MVDAWTTGKTFTCRYQGDENWMTPRCVTCKGLVEADPDLRDDEEDTNYGMDIILKALQEQSVAQPGQGRPKI